MLSFVHTGYEGRKKKSTKPEYFFCDACHLYDLAIKENIVLNLYLMHILIIKI